MLSAAAVFSCPARKPANSRLGSKVTAAKASYALAVVCKATPPAKSQHDLDLYIEAMEVLSKDQISYARETHAKLRLIAAAHRTESEPSQEKAFQQRKCRRLLRYPTMEQ